MTSAGWIIGFVACFGWIILVVVALSIVGIHRTHDEDDWFKDYQ